MDTDARRVARNSFIATVVVALSVVVLALFAQAMLIFMLVFAAILFALFLRAISDPFARRTGISPGWALALVVIALTLLVTVTVWLLAPSVATQAEQLAQQIPQAMQTLAQRLARHEWLGRLMEQLPTRAEVVAPTPGLLARLTSFASVTVAWLASALILVILGLYFATQPGVYFGGLLQLFPPRRRRRIAEVGRLLGHALRLWLLGRIILMVIVAVLTALGLKLLGIPLALTLGLIAGILDFIPNVGPIIAAVPATLIGLAQDPLTGAYVIGIFLFVQTLEGYILTPLVLQRTSDMPPALTLTVQVLLGTLFGFIGLFLAAPLAIVALVLVKELYIGDVLGNHDDSDKERRGE